MIGLYVACAIVGVGLIVLSALGGVFGHHDFGSASDASLDSGHFELSHGDVGHGDLAQGDASQGDIDQGVPAADHSLAEIGAATLQQSADAVAHAGLWLPFFSLRFWTYGLGAFGLIGTLLNLFHQGAEPLVGIASGASGLFLGTIAACAWRALVKQQTDTTAKERDFLGAIGTQSVTARDSNPGKVRVQVCGDIIDLIAVSDDGQTIPAGEEVVVVGIDGDRARVTRTSQLLNDD